MDVLSFDALWMADPFPAFLRIFSRWLLAAGMIGYRFVSEHQRTDEDRQHQKRNPQRNSIGNATIKKCSSQLIAGIAAIS
ncbi:MAG: hypothetical protein GYA18_04540 [Chloroflexi bacterium]|nr:hypothetical protein [Chloroflexota bacterium]